MSHFNDIINYPPIEKGGKPPGFPPPKKQTLLKLTHSIFHPVKKPCCKSIFSDGWLQILRPYRAARFKIWKNLRNLG